MVHRSCLFPGCSKPTFHSSSSDDGAVACGNLHHLQLMCQRFCAVHPELDPELRCFYSFRGSSVCGLSSCDLPPSSGHAFCSKSHFLIWLEKFVSKLTPQQRCRREGCSKHVFVNSDADKEPCKVYLFCGWTHRQEHTISNFFSSQPDEHIASHQSAEPSITHLIPSFKSYVLDKIKPLKHAVVDDDFFSKHPWEVLQPDQQSCTFFTKNTFKGKTGAKKRTTKDGYHWKPTGSEKECENRLRKKYLTYEKISGAADCSIDHKDRCPFSIKEYTLDDFPNHCIVHLYRRSQKTKPEGPVRKKMKWTINEENVQNVLEIHPPESDNNNHGAVILNGKGDGHEVSSLVSSQLGVEGHDLGMSFLRHSDDMGGIADTQDGKYSSSCNEDQDRMSCYEEDVNGSKGSWSPELLQGATTSSKAGVDGNEGSMSEIGGNGCGSMLMDAAEDDAITTDNAKSSGMLMGGTATATAFANGMLMGTATATATAIAKGMLIGTVEDDVTAIANANGTFNGGDTRADANGYGCVFEDDYGSSMLMGTVTANGTLMGTAEDDATAISFAIANANANGMFNGGDARADAHGYGYGCGFQDDYGGSILMGTATAIVNGGFQNDYGSSILMGTATATAIANANGMVMGIDEDDAAAIAFAIANANGMFNARDVRADAHGYACRYGCGFADDYGSSMLMATAIADANGMLMGTATDDATANGMFYGGDVRADAHGYGCGCGCGFQDDYGSNMLFDMPGMACVVGSTVRL